MIFMRILPGVLRELVKHVPTILFKTVDWGQLVSELPKLSRRMLQKEGYAELLEQLSKHLSEEGVEFRATLENPGSLKSKASGQKLLRLYFSQLFSPAGVFLDLRNHHFEEKQDQLLWHPSGLWTKLDENFRQGLLRVYDGFYLEDDQVYYQGLREIGLIQEDWSEEDKEKLGELFRKHFGLGLHAEMAFDLKTFQTSIIAMSDFLLKKETTISKDFLYLGIYLVTLYASLEGTQETYPVKDTYLSVRQNFSA